MVKVTYYLIITGLFTILEVVIERYTNLAQYNNWRWYWTFISVLIVLFINHSYYSWYKKELVPVSKVNYEYRIMCFDHLVDSSYRNVMVENTKE